MGSSVRSAETPGGCSDRSSPVFIPYPAPVKERFEATTLIDGLKQPMTFSILPDGRILYIEYKGAVKILHPNSRTPVDAATIHVTNANENGLLGMTIDPQFCKNGYVYLFYSPTDYSGQRLSRFVLRGDTLDMASEKHVLEFEEQRKDCCHHAGTLAFAPDGCMLISTGDNTHPGGDSDGYAPIDERVGKESFDAQKSASNMADLRGKILRIKIKSDGSYSIPKGNLFPKDGSCGRPEIYVMGCRNPWRMSVDSCTGYVYWGEVGPDAGGNGPRGTRGYDEVNQARKAGNFGWPYFVGPNAVYNRYDFATKKVGTPFDPNHPVNDSKNNTGLRDLPPAVPAWIYYPYAKSDVFPEVNEGSGRTACAGPVFHMNTNHNSNTKIPDYFDNCLFFYEWSRNWIKVARLDCNSNLVRIEPFMQGHPFSRPISMQFSDDGSLYVMEYGTTWGENKNARISRIDYIRGNRRPVAKAKTTNNIGKTPLTVSFSGSDSSDPDGDVLKYEWRIGADGAVMSTDAVCKYTFTTPGVYTIQLTVSDPSGAKSTSTVPVLAGNAPPKVSFIRPKDGDFFTPGTPLVYRLFIDDEEDGDSDQKEDAMAPRAVVEAARSKTKNGSEGNADSDPDGLKLMKKSDCFNCHAVDRKVLGPAYRDVALKYKGDANAMAESVQRVIKGSTKVWGDVPMLPHPQHTLDEVRSMVAWVYSLKDGTSGKMIGKGVKGSIAFEAPKDGKDDKNAGGYLVLEAVYTDAGTPAVGPLTGSARVVLRPRQIEAEHCDSFKGAVRSLAGGSASGGHFMGAIDHNDQLVFKSLNLSGLKKITCRFASDGVGGRIRILAGGLDGTLLAEFDVAKTGGWEKWVEKNVDVMNAPNERKDVTVHFVNPGKGGLMNLDWIKFE
ncbi:MAG: PQQ-dependent sugar dehydrogenase [Planctomycetota bacterium]